MKRAGPRLVVKDTGTYGKGVYAGKDIAKGEVIHTLSGKRMSLSQVVDKINTGKENMDDPFQIGRRTYIDLDELSRTFNHSCDPNGGIRNVSELFALRDIPEGEQITYDYSMTISPTEWEMHCACGSKSCRKVLEDVRSVPKKRREAYKKQGAVQRYMRDLLKEIDDGTYTMPRYEVLALERLT